MRVSTANTFDASIATLQRRQQQLQESQQRLTSGKRVERASDDPTGAARAERALAAEGRIDANQRALEASRNAMTLTEGALGDAAEILQQVREAMIAAGNATYSDPERRGLATKIEGLRNQLLSIANRPDGSGGYLFSGQGASEPPFLDQPGGVSYKGTAGAVYTGNLENYQLTVDGQQAWELARSGNGSFVTGTLPNSISGAAATSWINAGQVTDPSALTGANYEIRISGSGPGATYSVVDTGTGSTVQTATYVSGKAIEFDGMAMTITGDATDGDRFEVKPASASLKVFDVLDQAIADLRMGNRGATQIAQSNALTLRDVDAVFGNLQNVRTQVGEQLNNLDGSENRQSALKLYNQSERSAATDLDMIEGISNFQNQQSGYEAALKTYSMVQRLSLFQYINS